MNDEKQNSIEKIVKNLKKIVTEKISIILFYTTKRNIKKHNLNRKKEDVTKVILPEELTEEINIENLISQKYSEEILNFTKIIIEKFSKEDLTIFYNNIKNLKVETVPSIAHIFLKDKGVYNIKTNKIFIFEKSADVTIYHELFHMASSKKIENNFFSGFEISVPEYNYLPIGEGLTEGYTELLARRYFNTDNQVYEEQVFYAKKLEQIIGKEKMESLYLNADLNGLFNELKEYATPKEIVQFNADIDHTLKFSGIADKKMLPEKIKEQYKTCAKNIYKFLIKCYTKKRFNEIETIEKKEIYEEKMIKFIDEFVEYITDFPQGFFIGENIIDVIDDETLQEFIDIGSEIIGFELPLELTPSNSK